MAVSVVAAGAAQVAGTTSAGTAAITPTLPTGSAGRDRVYVFQSHSCATGSAATPTDWTALYKDAVVGTGTPAAGAGQRFISCYYRDYDGLWAMPSFALLSVAQNSHAIAPITLRKAVTEVWNTPTASSIATDYGGTVNTSFSATTTSFTTVVSAGLMAHVTTNDNVTSTTQVITGTNSFTSGTVTERSDGGTATGNDVSIKLHSALPSAAASPAGTLTHTATLSAASEGGVCFVQQTVGSPPKVETLVDDFATQDGTKWSYSANASATSGRLQITTPDAGQYLALSYGIFDLTASYAIAELVQTPGASAMGLQLRNTSDITDSAGFVWYGGNLIFRETVNGVDSDTSLAYDTTNHRWLRIRETSGTLYWEGSPTGASWTTLRSKSPGFTITNVEVLVYAGFVAGSTALWDNFNNPPSGTDYTPSITPEAVGITDSVAKDVGKTATDAVGVTDSVTKDAGRTLTDAVGVTDSVTKDAGKTATDNVGVTDSFSVVSDYGVVATDAVGVTDSYSQTQDWVRDTTDPVGVTDSATVGVDYVVTAADSVGITDAASAGQGFDRSATDLVGVADAASIQQDWVRSQTDNVGVTDSLSLDAGRAATDPVGVTDSFAAQQDWSQTYTDPVGLADALALDAGRFATDPVGVTDTASVQQDWVRTQTDPVGVTDSYVLDLGRLATDPLTIADAVSLAQDWVRSDSDVVGVTDSGSFDLAGAGDATDTDQIGVSDTLGATVDAVKSYTDTVGVTDSAVFEILFSVDADDSVGITDALAVSAVYERAWTDPVGVADSASFIITEPLAASVSDDVGVTDSPDIVADYARSLSDPVGVLDDADFQLDLGPVDVERGFADLVGLADSAWFAIRVGPGPDNTWVARPESAIHTPPTESRHHAGPTEVTRYPLKTEYNTEAARAETTHLEVIG